MKKDKIKFSHLPPAFFIETTGIKERTFYDRAVKRDVNTIQLYRNPNKFYSIDDWNRKNPDYIFKLSEVDWA